MVDLNRHVSCWAGRAVLVVALLVLVASYAGGWSLSIAEKGASALALAASALFLTILSGDD